jgi:hypothetical protein
MFKFVAIQISPKTELAAGTLHNQKIKKFPKQKYA